MKRGPKPIPTQLKLLRGNPGRRKINKREPQPSGNLTAAPSHFDEELREVWDYAIKHAPAGLLKMIDSSVLETWVTAHVLHRKAVSEVRKFGMLMKAPNTGLPIQSPFLPVVNKQAFIMMRAVDHLGFSPASRSRIFSETETAGASNSWESVSIG